MESDRAKALRITNSRENNLKEVSLEIPHDTFTVVTGLSGSGKSSLAFDTVYAEGQRRYIETFSPYTRQFFDKVKKPDVDTIENVRPAIAIQQRTRILSSRSTVGSMTNLNDYLKILWSNLAYAVCPECNSTLTSWSSSTLSRHLHSLFKANTDRTFYIGAYHAVSNKAKELRGELDRLVTLGFSRVIDLNSGNISNLEEVGDPFLTRDDQLVLILDRIKGGSVSLKRVQDAVQQSFAISEGSCLLIEVQGDDTSVEQFHESFYCSIHKIAVQKPRPSLFSYNHPYGACPNCKGFGKILEIDRALCVPDTSLSIKEHAVQCWSGTSARSVYRRLLRFAEKNEIPTDAPWKTLLPEQREIIFTHKSREFVGILPWFKRLERKIYKMHVRVFLSRYRMQATCPECHGTRLKRDALAYRIDEKVISDAWALSISELLKWVENLQLKTRSQKELSNQLKEVFSNIISRLQYLQDLGLPYLDLDRQARTLSGGETQRVNLAAALGSELVSTHFVLDEPSVGLHARDTERLIAAIRDLAAKQNSLLVVEHDLECIDAADHVIEIGPGAGKEGGEIIFNGESSRWAGIPTRNEEIIASPTTAIDSGSFETRYLEVRGARARNLKDISVSIPLNRLVCLTGVSGSGKSTLIHEVLKKAYEARDDTPTDYDKVLGFDQIEQLILVDQSPLSKTPRANIATYSKIWDVVRTLLESTEAARLRALTRSSFSFNVNAGRCLACEGAGFIKEDMQFLSDVFIPCESCLGRRFQEIVLEVRYREKNADDFLRMTIDEAHDFFQESAVVKETTRTLSLLGLGHLTLGHPLSELSGGEAQRLKLVPFLQKSATGRSLLIFDEPTTGLHYADVQRLLNLFSLLIKRGHSILCVEHNLSVISQCDWIVDIGPEGGDGGGEIVFTGTPFEAISLQARKDSHTTRYLKEHQSRIRSKNSKGKVSNIQERANSTPNKKQKMLTIRGAREHNLKNLDIEIPLDRVVALTGVSGSGKSSIAKDIIYAEGQRRYLDCLSPYARQFIKELKRPEIDGISNVKPTICIYQHTFQPSRLSTIATMSEVYNFLRLLYAKIGIQYCPDHPNMPISPLSARDIAENIKELKTSSLRLLAPIIKLKKGLHKPIFERALSSEISEVRVDGVFARPSQFIEGLQKTKPHSIDFVVAKFNPKNLSVDIIQEAVTLGLSLGGGTLVAFTGDEEIIYSTERTCSICKRGFYKPDPEDLSFNSRRGACKTCLGTGRSSDGETCTECAGSRLNEVGRNIRISEKSIYELCQFSAPILSQFLQKLPLDTRRIKISEPILKEVFAKLDALTSLGLDYIELNRDCSTLSGGELQRLRLGTAMGSPLAGVLYIFDEPSMGLHPYDNSRVLSKIRSLADAGNSVIMIEHDAQSILSTDYVIDIGPGGGTEGGHIVYSGPTESFLADEDSVTARSLRHSQNDSYIKDSKFIPEWRLKVRGVTYNNIKALDLDIPLGCLVTFAGVSGAGKSSLVHGVISDGITFSKKPTFKWNARGGTLESSVKLERVLLVDQKPIGINSRSTPASYLGIWDEIRKLFARTLEAQSRGWSPGYFSYNTGKGRCPDCKGQGYMKLEMNFLAEAHVLCETCKGSRYHDEIESVRYLNRSVSDVLGLTFEEAKTLFANHRKIHHPLKQACDLGLGYLTLGQGSSTLSGGESQRIKLVSELSSRSTKHTLYILDEPTTGLHKADVSRLMKSLEALVELGNSVFIIEHDLDVLRRSDYIIELGPGPAGRGGRVIFKGAPQDLLASSTPWGELFRDEGGGFAQPAEDRRVVTRLNSA